MMAWTIESKVLLWLTLLVCPVFAIAFVNIKGFCAAFELGIKSDYWVRGHMDHSVTKFRLKYFSTRQILCTYLPTRHMPHFGEEIKLCIPTTTGTKLDLP